MRGYLPQHWPTWFKPHLIDFAPQPFGPFPGSYSLTSAGDVHLVPTPGHTSGHYLVIVQEDEHAIFFAADSSYTQQLLFDDAVDGEPYGTQRLPKDITGDPAHTCNPVPSIYLPSHDPEAANRLATRNEVHPVNV